MSQRIPIECKRSVTPLHKPLQIGQIGITQSNVPAIFLYCRGHRSFHASTLPGLLQSWREMFAGDEAGLRGYKSILEKAILNLDADLEDMETKKESA